MSEKQVPLPLTGAEVREAILFKLEESLIKTCHLTDVSAYTSFRCEVRVNITLSDFGREVSDNHIVTASAGEVSPEAVSSETKFTIDPMPPNQLRIATGQDVPVKTQKDGKTVIRKVKYAARKETK